MDHENIIRKRVDVPVAYTWATEDIFPSDEAWEAEFCRVKGELSSYERFRGHLGDSAKMLYGCLQFDEEVGAAIDKLYGYAHLRSDVDTGNPVYQKLLGRAASLYSEASAASSFLTSEILAIPAEDRKSVV